MRTSDQNDDCFGMVSSDQCLLYPRRRTLELGREALDLWAAQLMKLVTAQPKPKACREAGENCRVTTFVFSPRSMLKFHRVEAFWPAAKMVRAFAKGKVYTSGRCCGGCDLVLVDFVLRQEI